MISSEQSFHGRTISTASATGQATHRERFNPLMPNYRFVPYNDVRAIREELDSAVAAVILEPIQGEGRSDPCRRIPGGGEQVVPGERRLKSTIVAWTRVSSCSRRRRR